jgi:hypothetical protein
VAGVSDIETVQVDPVSSERRAPLDLVGRVEQIRSGNWLRVDTYGYEPGLGVGDVVLLRAVERAGGHFRSGRATIVEVSSGASFTDIHLDQCIVAQAEGDYVYRIGKPLTPSLEERVARLERMVYPDLAVADDAEKSGKPEVAAKLRAKHDASWQNDPEIDWTGIER